MTRILAIGDVVGKAGRRGLTEQLPVAIEAHNPDLVIVNGENAAGGFGLTPAIADGFFELGADVITLGNHAWDQRPLKRHVVDEPRILRALNIGESAHGSASGIFTAKNGARVLVTQVLGNLFMSPKYGDAFEAIDQFLEANALARDCDALIIDVHAEATSEKMALGHYADGRSSFVFGTHTHIPTADAQVLPGGTAYISDLGMTGDYDSVIGMKKSTSLSRFTKTLPPERMVPANGEPTLCGALVDVGSDGLAGSINPVRLGGRLQSS